MCVTLLLKQSLSRFYVTNLTDPGFPFTGVIEATNIIPKDILGDKALIYLPRYVAPDDPFVEISDDEVLEVFISALRRIFPHLRNGDIIAKLVNREVNVQPLLDVGYSARLPTMRTPLQNLYMVNTTMISNSTLNNNQVIRLARKAAHLLLNEN